jgi:hypothetical protein
MDVIKAWAIVLGVAAGGMMCIIGFAAAMTYIAKWFGLLSDC